MQGDPSMARGVQYNPERNSWQVRPQMHGYSSETFDFLYAATNTTHHSKPTCPST
jgi:hypothetical protein